MLEFLHQIPTSAGLDWVKDDIYLRHFELERIGIMRRMISHQFKEGGCFTVLDFGYLHGLVPEFIHRAFPKSSFTVCDRPDSPVFKNQEYLALIQSRPYLELKPLDIAEVGALGRKFDLIILGEIIEHLDPTRVASILETLRGMVAPGGMLIVTTPNASGLYNNLMIMAGKESVLLPPIPEPDMGYGHIHLWPPQTLRQTGEVKGWKMTQVVFYHGRESEMRERFGRMGRFYFGRTMLAAIALLTRWKARLKGFYVMGFVAAGK